MPKTDSMKIEAAYRAWGKANSEAEDSQEAFLEAYRNGRHSPELALATATLVAKAVLLWDVYYALEYTDSAGRDG